MPRVIVELGTHGGASYAALCEPVLRLALPTKCFAVDTWTGDRHSGHYEDDVFRDLDAFNTSRYGQFSTLLRMPFDDALDRFPDGSVDLLHIDGFHTYEAVRHDFEAWRPKLSDRAVALFHDIAEHRQDFGVWRYWAELERHYPTFEFEHEHGLGVLLVGDRLEGPARMLFGDLSTADTARIRARFRYLGEHRDVLGRISQAAVTPST